MEGSLEQNMPHLFFFILWPPPRLPRPVLVHSNRITIHKQNGSVARYTYLDIISSVSHYNLRSMALDVAEVLQVVFGLLLP